MVSIIVPLYNAEKYLRKCLDSIIGQTFEDWELILVDDGSKDASGNICDEYSQKDSRIKVFHKPNGGVSSARNVGIEHTCGDWITFVDADDWLDECFLENILDVPFNDADFIIGGNTMVGHRNEVNKYCKNPIKRNIREIDFSSNKCLFLFYFPWGRLFNTDIIKRNKVKFHENMRIAEDSDFIIQYLSFCNNLVLLPTSDYIHNCGAGVTLYSLTFREFKNYQTNFIQDSELFYGFHLININFVRDHFIMVLFSFYLQRLKHLHTIDEYYKQTKHWNIHSWNKTASMMKYSWFKKNVYYVFFAIPYIGYLYQKLRQIKI
ncbi:MAG: glycosyltransferase family 2 protein [Prevotella sp.]|nr:glycosyltransferase family 2 protein [Candidatus Prevotella equi]